MTVVVMSSPPHAEIPIPVPIPSTAAAVTIAARFIRPLSLARKRHRTLPESVGDEPPVHPSSESDPQMLGNDVDRWQSRHNGIVFAIRLSVGSPLT
jgi:hypothetical protein